MTKNEFRELFLKALNAAADDAEARLGKPIPRSFTIELHAPGSQGRRTDVGEAIDQIYLGKNRFFRIIDVAIRSLTPGNTVAFVRVSGHEPAAFDRTWDPSSFGPFKQIIADEIEDRSVPAA
ncbi:MAG TPA: hypothetical protein VGF34_10150 [Stellaceae bacterium]|jgi:hypothetical protein